jgi:hypothetical protein
MTNPRKPIRTGDFARALRDYYPTVSVDTVHHWLETGQLESYPRPGDKGWYALIPSSIVTFCQQVLWLDRQDIHHILSALGLATRPAP